MMTSEPAIFTQVRCRRCDARLFDARPAVRQCEVSVADVVLVCWRCKSLVGFRLISQEATDD